MSAQVAGVRCAEMAPLLPAPAALAFNLNVWPPSSVYGGVGLGNNPMAGES